MFDLFTIGAGSGGVRASRIAASLGARVGIAESRFFGGTCVNVGCVPKKLMVYASHFREELHDAGGFGWTIDAPSFDWPTFLRRKDAEIDRLNQVYRRLLSGSGVTVTEGHARLVDAHTVEVTHPNQERSTYQAKNILIATGGKAQRPTIPGAEHCMISDDVFRLPRLPKKIAIVGGGYIAIEFAGVFRGLGAEVTLIHRGERFLRGFDDELCSFLAEEIKKKGIHIFFSETITHVERQGEQLHVSLANRPALSVDAVLYATGRTPNTASLGLQDVGVLLGARGEILVNDRLQTNIPNIYALGDVIDRVCLTPVALAEGMTLARNLFGGQSKQINYENIATAVFSQPPLATVGLSEAKALETHDEIEVYATTFTPLKHTLSGSTEKTFMKLLVAAKSRLVVGVHMVGADAPEIIQMAAIALQCGATKEQFDATIGIHPTAAEEFVTMRTKRKRAA